MSMIPFQVTFGLHELSLVTELTIAEILSGFKLSILIHHVSQVVYLFHSELVNRPY